MESHLLHVKLRPYSHDELQGNNVYTIGTPAPETPKQLYVSFCSSNFYTACIYSYILYMQLTTHDQEILQRIVSLQQKEDHM